MTLIGKIFTVLIFLMSILFMAFAVSVYATHKNWREAVQRPQKDVRPGVELGLYYQKQNLERTIEQLRTEVERIKNELARERAARVHALAVLESEVQQKQMELAALEKQNLELTDSQTQAIATVSTIQNTLSALKGEVSGLRDDVRVAREDRDRQFEKVVTLNDQIGQAQGELARMTTEREKLLGEIGQITQVLTAHGLTKASKLPDVPPLLDGVVYRVRSDFVELSLGSDDGIKVGHEVEVFRNNQYLGRAVIRKVDVDRAVGQLIKEYNRAPVQEGDRVQTRTKVS